jgi:3-(3-hydroxy-phenyl)propionate hydroxylase
MAQTPHLEGTNQGANMNYVFTDYPFNAERHEARLPVLRDGVEEVRHSVAIVGGGPVGLAVALGLANYGVRSVLIEADDSVCSGSRAICISRRSLEIIERLGAVDGFLSTGLPWTGGRSYYRDAEVLHFQMPHDENQKLPPMVNLQQYYIEHFLLQAAKRKPELIDIRWQTKMSQMESTDDGAILTVETPKGAYKLQTEWVVAADGGRSAVREALGVKLQGTTYEGRYVIVDVLLKSKRPTERLAFFDPPSNPGSTILVHKQPDDVWRIDYQLRDDEDPVEAVKPENAMPRVRSLLEMMGEPTDWAPIWITLYKANALTLDRYRHERVLFAGDAAHLVPIFGVRGANSGFEDADNLAWKLAFVVRGLASDRLLESYSDERVQATHENLRHGMKSTEFMAPPSFAFEFMRDAVLSLAVKHSEVSSLINPRQTQAMVYSDSRINRFAQRSAEFKMGPGPGAAVPEYPVTIVERGEAREAHLTDLVASRFTALYFTDDGSVPADLASIERNLSELKIPLKLIPIHRHLHLNMDRLAGWDHTGQIFNTYAASHGSLYLLRPDGHVMARWREAVASEVAQAVKDVLQ